MAVGAGAVGAGKACLDGELVELAEAHVCVLDRGLLYGQGVFETLRTYGGRPFELEAHVERLLRSAALAGIASRVPRDLWEREVRETVEHAALPEATLRLLMTGGVAEPGLGASAHASEGLPTRVVLALPLRPYDDELYRDGVEVALGRMALATEGGPAAGAKVTSYQPNLLAVREARCRGAHEWIALGPEGELREGSSSNLFVLRDGVLRTPPLGLGILPGITRSVVLDLARGLGLPTEETLLFPRDLYDAEEAFLTSSLRELLPAVRADGEPVGAGRPGPLTRRLHAAYRGRTGSSPLAPPAEGPR